MISGEFVSGKRKHISKKNTLFWGKGQFWEKENISEENISPKRKNMFGAGNTISG